MSQSFADEIMTQYSSMSVSELIDYYAGNRDSIARALRNQQSGIRTIGLYYGRMRLGGVERVISLLIPVWLQEGYRVVLFTEEEPTPDDFPVPGETVRIVLPKEAAELKMRLTKLEEALLSEQVDVYIDHEWGDGRMFPEMLLIKRHHIPYILYTHGQFSTIYRFWYDYNLNSHRIFALCDLVLTLSETNRHFYELCHCHVKDIHNPIAPELKEVVPVQTAPDNHQVVWIGRFSGEKRPLDAIRVMKEVCAQVPDATLQMVGSGPEADMAEAKALCRELGIEKNVIFCGWQSDVTGFYRDSAIVLMTSDTEGYPNVLIEAKAYGKILAMYSLPYLTMTKSGLGVRTARVGDVSGLAAEIVSVFTDAGLRKRLEEEAVRSFAEFKEYSQADLWNGIMREMEQADSRSTTGSTGNSPTDNRPTDDGPLMISMLLNDADIAHKCGQKAMETYPDFRVGHAVLKIPRMIKHLLRL